MPRQKTAMRANLVAAMSKLFARETEGDNDRLMGLRVFYIESLIYVMCEAWALKRDQIIF